MKTIIALLFASAITMISTATATDSITVRQVTGEYYFGDGLGVNCTLKLQDTRKFRFEWHGCLGIYDQNNGGFTLKDGVLSIRPNKPNVRKGFSGTPTDFFAIPWGSRLYLVPTNDIVEFCSDVNQGSEPRRGNWGHYYLRRDDWNKEVWGNPDVPEQWRKFFLSKPLKGKIVELIGTREAWLDLGSNDGLLEGMILTAQDRGKVMFSQVRVESVEERRCRIKCKWTDSRLAVGQTVTSRFHE